MSQRTFRIEHDGGHALEVMSGWAPPFGRFFLLVEDMDGDANGTGTPGAEFLYSNLVDPEFDGSLAYIVGVLDRLGLPRPASFARDLEADRAADAANTVHDYGVAVLPAGWIG